MRLQPISEIHPEALYLEPRKYFVIQEWMDCTEIEAAEWFNYNTAGAWCGEGTPTFVEIKECDYDSKRY